jgi:transcriptional regulator with XRE-family HTH domain
MSQEELFINGELLRLRRESRGWVLNDMATRACMSVKQIRQIEEGGMSAFYSMAVKLTAAKKVGALLGVAPDEIFSQSLEVLSDDEVAIPKAEDQIALDTAAEVAVAAQDQDTVHIEPEVLVHPLVDTPVADSAKSKTSLWVIFGLFAAALAVAAYLQPKDEIAAEPAPPIQVLPAEPADASSAASADVPASSAESSVVPASVPLTVQKPASLPSSVSSMPRVSLGIPSVPASAASRAQ